MPKTKRHPKSSQASATPVTDGRRVDRVVRIRRALRVRHRRQAALERATSACSNAGWFYDPDYEWGIGSSPIIWKNLVIVQCDIQKNSFIAAFDVATGAARVAHGRAKRFRRGRRRRSSRANGRAELVTQATDVHARLRSGERQGAVAAVGQFRDRDSDADRRTRTSSSSPTAIAACSRSSRSSRARPGDITLKGDQTQSASIAWSTTRGGPYIPTPVIYGDQLYVAADQRRARRLRRPARAARLPGARRAGGGSFQRVARRRRRQDLSHERRRRRVVVEAGPTA